jgi:hypothetical protein
MKNLLIGAISGNYSVDDISGWIETSQFDNTERVLLLYNNINDELVDYLNKNKVIIFNPNFDFWSNEKASFETNTGNNTLESSYNLIHNLRFFHIWYFLQDNENHWDKIIITDVKDVYFNSNPFSDLEDNKITATSEIIKYSEEEWNKQHIIANLGVIGYKLLLNKPVYNVGVFGGDAQLVQDICADIYLLSVGKVKVADQTSFNYLIQTKYKNITNFTENVAVHLHVVNAGLVDISLDKIPSYKIVHQYDRIPGFKR